MGLMINTNIAAINSYRNLQGSQLSLNTSLERLSSGLRINRAADDAAGLAISESLRSQVNGLNQAIANAQDGISLVQTAEGAMNEAHAIMQRLRKLAVQASNGTNSSTNITQIKEEVDQLQEELGKIADRAKFNGTSLLGGGTVTLQVGAYASNTMVVNLASLTSVAGVDFTSATTARNSINDIDTAISSLATSRAKLGAVQNRLQHTINNLGVSSENLSASESRIRDADVAKEMANFTRANILQNAGVSMLAQANMAPQSVLKLLG